MCKLCQDISDQINCQLQGDTALSILSENQSLAKYNQRKLQYFEIKEIITVWNIEL